MSRETPNTVQIKILNKAYAIACAPDEEHLLLESAQLLNERMQEIHKAGKLGDTERIAVMAALNIAHDLVKVQAELHQNQLLTEQHLNRINEKIDRALASKYHPENTD